MRQVIIELDEETLRRLDEVAPARARRRSEFIRGAIRRALDSVEERRMAEAYRNYPDESIESLDLATWELPARKPGRRRR